MMADKRKKKLSQFVFLTTSAFFMSSRKSSYLRETRIKMLHFHTALRKRKNEIIPCVIRHCPWKHLEFIDGRINGVESERTSGFSCCSRSLHNQFHFIYPSIHNVTVTSATFHIWCADCFSLSVNDFGCCTYTSACFKVV